MEGWTGKILRVNLTEEKIAVEDLDHKLASSFLGGRGIGAKILFDEVGPGVNPLDDANKLIFATGPLTATGAIAGALCNVATKSPLTGGITSASLRGNFGGELKFSGFDVIIIEGKSKFPVYLSIMDDRIRLMPALHLWGRTTDQTETLLKAEMDDIWKAREIRVVSIGPAGEKSVNIASLVHENCMAFGGSGVGTVMGAKNLKAIAIKGTKSIKVAKGSRFLLTISSLLDRIKSDSLISEKIRSSGTIFLAETIHQMGALPVQNFQTALFSPIKNVGAGALAYPVLRGHRSCLTCPIGCLNITEARGSSSNGRAVGLDYNTVAMLGPNLGIDHLPTIAKAYFLCIQLGIDPISLGAAIATATEVYEKGMIPEDDTGQRLGFGQGEGLISLIHLVGEAKGFGCTLGSGAFEIARAYEYIESFMGVKKREFSPYDPRVIQGMGLHFATSNFGAHHLEGYTIINEILGIHGEAHPLETDGKASEVKLFQDVTAVLSAMGICPISLTCIWVEDMVNMINDILGTNHQIDDILKIGERIWNLERLFNLKAGFTGADDTLPERMLSEPIPDGPAKGGICYINKMLAQYYQLRGWDDKGIPTEQKIKEMDL